MSSLCKFFNIKNCKSRICNCFTKNCTSIFFECGIQFFFCTIRTYESNINAHFFHCYGNKIKSSAINRRTGNNVTSTFTDIEERKKVCSLTRRSEHSCSSAFQLRNLCGYIIISRILKTSIKIPAGFKIKEFSHVLAGTIFEGC